MHQQALPPTPHLDIIETALKNKNGAMLLPHELNLYSYVLGFRKNYISLAQMGAGHLDMTKVQQADTAVGAIIDPAYVITLQNPKHICAADGNANITLGIYGYQIAFKLDTAARTTAVDARNIKWSYDENENRLLKETADMLYKKHLIDQPNQGYMSVARAQQIGFDVFEDMQDFGTVTSFDLVIDENKNAPELDHIETINGNFPVIGISNPKSASAKEGKGLRPVILLPFTHPGINSDMLAVSLVDRAGLTKRGLFGINDMKANGFSITFSENKANQTLALDKLNDRIVRQIGKVLSLD